MSPTCPAAHWPRPHTYDHCHIWGLQRKYGEHCCSYGCVRVCVSMINHLLSCVSSWGKAFPLLSLTSWSKQTSQRVMIWNNKNGKGKVDSFQADVSCVHIHLCVFIITAHKWYCKYIFGTEEILNMLPDTQEEVYRSMVYIEKCYFLVPTVHFWFMSLTSYDTYFAQQDDIQ